jgi:curli biogenesis system outer membrane secretion channel CsgG
MPSIPISSCMVLRLWTSSVIALAAFMPADAAAQSPSERKRLAVAPAAVAAAVRETAKAGGTERDLNLVLESLHTVLSDQVVSSRKFDLLARDGGSSNGWSRIMQEQDFGSSGNVDPSSAAKFGLALGAQYLVLTTVTDFHSAAESVRFEGIGVSATRQAIRLGCSVQIVDTTTGQVLESARFRGREVASDGATVESAFVRIVDRLGADILSRIVDVIYPAKVVAKLGDQVTINRGDGTQLSVGQRWAVFALGEEIVDPDTGEKLGANEIEIGSFAITRITARLSYGEVIEDNGIQVGSIARPIRIDDEVALPAAPSKPTDPRRLNVTGDL